MLRPLLFSILVCTVSLAQDVVGDLVEPSPDISIKALMLSQITPASDTLWGVDEPQSGAEWQVLDAAALSLIKAFEVARAGGSGSLDRQWASSATWQMFIDQEIAALSSARQAIKARNLEKLMQANDALYTPCETCHIEFNPGVTAE